MKGLASEDHTRSPPSSNPDRAEGNLRQVYPTVTFSLENHHSQLKILKLIRVATLESPHLKLVEVLKKRPRSLKGAPLECVSCRFPRHQRGLLSPGQLTELRERCTPRNSSLSVQYGAPRIHTRAGCPSWSQGDCRLAGHLITLPPPEK